MRNPLLVPDLRELIGAGEAASVRDFFDDQHPARIAEFLEDLEPREADAILQVLEPRVRAELLGYLEPEFQVRVVEAMAPADSAEMLHLMSHDERADLVNRLDDDIVDEILRRLAHAEREDIRRLASYEPGTAGAAMTTDYAVLPPHLTRREAIDQLIREAPDRETIYYSYVVDEHRRLLGFVSLKDLLLARPRARIEEIMKTDLVRARIGDDQEDVARQIEEYDLLAIPVVDADDRLVGIITHDDAADILRQEQTEDILRFGGVQAEAEGDEETYWQARILQGVKRRIVWLSLLFGGGTLTGLVVKTFGGVERGYGGIDFDAFIPLLIGTGGNAGSQTVGTVIRALALGEIDPKTDTLRVMLREASTGLLLGLALGPLGFLFAWLVMGSPASFSLVIALAILGICVWANGVGALVPMLARRFAIDPAVVSAPAISTLVDATGLFIFYKIAEVIRTALL
jgi:magnesium transporter